MVDPFDAFGGSDSDSDESDDDDDVQTKKAQALLLAANRKGSNGTHKGSDAKSETITTPGPEGESPRAPVDLTHLEPCHVAWDPALYVSPDIMLVSSLPVGGGRGYVALKDLTPGTLVLVEEAIMAWPGEQLGQPLTLESVQRLFHHPNATKIVQCLEDFHPSKTVVDSTVESDSPEQVETMLESLQEKHKSDPLLAQLEKDAQSVSIKNRDGSVLSANDILRLFLALRYNGLESGIYTHVAMLNHNCQPNCVKFLPGSEQSDLPSTYSEVRTTCGVKAGESLTISYMPKLVSHASRRRHLWEQHRFDIGVNMKANLRRMEIINSGLPSSSKEYVDEDSLSSRIERSIAEMELLYATIKDSLEQAPFNIVESWEQAKALEVTSLELLAESERQLHNDNQLLLIPCLVMHLHACELVIDQDAKNQSLSHTQRCKLLCRTVSTALRLVELQKLFWGDCHFDVARTYLDLSQAIEELLGQSQLQLLIALEPNRSDLKSFRDWSAFEYRCRKEHERIKDCYPRDALEYIRKDRMIKEG